ncbi:hypothetical protein KFK09_027613 [Dendrobium nobile]|uniref:Uncharacterized protein n=1 Tax=Dendrobium nobile TaxID=94219 RepID=A0A8T3A9T4_DENNO|nr:hypothetical protein KFK09_027613 [Dendrobium nobile]
MIGEIRVQSTSKRRCRLKLSLSTLDDRLSNQALLPSQLKFGCLYRWKHGFVNIFLVRGIWGGASYIKKNQFHYMNKMEYNNNYNNRVWNGAQPVASLRTRTEDYYKPSWHSL